MFGRRQESDPKGLECRVLSKLHLRNGGGCRKWGRDENQETCLQRLLKSLLCTLLEAVSEVILDQIVVDEQEWGRVHFTGVGHLSRFLQLLKGGSGPVGS